MFDIYLPKSKVSFCQLLKFFEHVEYIAQLEWGLVFVRKFIHPKSKVDYILVQLGQNCYYLSFDREDKVIRYRYCDELVTQIVDWKKLSYDDLKVTILFIVRQLRLKKSRWFSGKIVKVDPDSFVKCE